MPRLSKVIVYILLISINFVMIDTALAWSMPAWIKALGDTAVIFTRLVTGFSYLLGLFFVIRAVMALKQAGQNSMGGGGADNSHLMSALVNLLVGVAFVYMPGMISMMMETFYNQKSIMAYSSLGFAASQFDDLIGVLQLIIQLIGYIAFIRGWLLLSRLGHHGGAQPGTVPKAIMHIIGGLLAVNIFGTISLLRSMVGY